MRLRQSRKQTGPAGCEANGAIRDETIGLTAGAA
jgi:hypothetical protein